jgi:hypothetical protein
MHNLTRPSRVARGPGLPALRVHGSPPSVTGLARPDSSRSRQSHSSAKHSAGGITHGQSTRDPPPPITCRLWLCRHAAVRVPGAAQRVALAERCAAEPGSFQTPFVRRSRFCSASPRAALRPGHERDVITRAARRGCCRLPASDTRRQQYQSSGIEAPCYVKGRRRSPHASRIAPMEKSRRILICTAGSAMAPSAASSMVNGAGGIQS